MRRSSRVLPILVCLVFALLAPAVARAGGPVVINGGFEDDLTGWTIDKGAGMQSSGPSPTPGCESGEYCLRFIRTEFPAETQYHQAIDVSGYPGALLVTAHILRADGTAPGQISVAFANDDSCALGPAAWTPVVVADDDTSNGVWHQGTALVTVDAEDYLCIFLWGEENQLYFDSITITQQPTAVRLGDLSVGHGWEIPTLSLLGAMVVLLLIRPRRRRR